MNTFSPDMGLLELKLYEDYLDTFITSDDLRFLRDIRFCRQLVTLNYRLSTEVYSQTQFEALKEIAREQLSPSKHKNVIYGTKLRTFDPVLFELAVRERPNYQKIISTIIFLTHRNKNGFEVSGFVDFEDSLQRANMKLPEATDWSNVFRDKVKFRPTPRDLSFYNPKRNSIQFNNSENYIVLHDVNDGLIFMHRGDHKKICVDNTRRQSDQNYIRSVIYSIKYGYVVFYDHISISPNSDLVGMKEKLKQCFDVV